MSTTIAVVDVMVDTEARVIGLRFDSSPDVYAFSANLAADVGRALVDAAATYPDAVSGGTS